MKILHDRHRRHYLLVKEGRKLLQVIAFEDTWLHFTYLDAHDQAKLGIQPIQYPLDKALDHLRRRAQAHSATDPVLVLLGLKTPPDDQSALIEALRRKVGIASPAQGKLC